MGKHIPDHCGNFGHVRGHIADALDGRTSHRVPETLRLGCHLFHFHCVRLYVLLGFWAEAFGIWAFGMYWLVKTKELSLSDVERRALKGDLDMDISTLR